MSKANEKSRKGTHIFIDMTRISRVIVMPQAGTIAYRDRAELRLPYVINTDMYESKFTYEKSLKKALAKANKVQEAIESIKKGGKKIYNGGTFILEKEVRSSKKVETA